MARRLFTERVGVFPMKSGQKTIFLTSFSDVCLKIAKIEDTLIIRIGNVVRYDVQLKTKKCEYLDQSAVNPLPKKLSRIKKIVQQI